MVKNGALAEQVAGFDRFASRDFDPEEEGSQQNSDPGSCSQDSEDDLAGTEHYVEVGKSRLRKLEGVTLGPQYAGSRVSRKFFEASDGSDGEYEDARTSLEPESFADPEAVDMDVNDEDGDEDEDIDSDDAFVESDAERFQGFTFRGSAKPVEVKIRRNRNTAADFNTEKYQEEDAKSKEETESSDEDEDIMDEVEGSVENTAEDLSEDENSELKVVEENDSESNSGDEIEGDEEDEEIDDVDNEKARRAELRKIMNEDRRIVVSTISQAAKTDAEKGVAIKSQRKTFDSLLNVRIRLQKTLIATNSIITIEGKDTDVTQPYQEAEEAAIRLLNTLDTMRQELEKARGSAKQSMKRKRAIDVETPSSAIWQIIQDSESAVATTRHATLEKWFSKVQSATVLRKLNNSAQATITDIINEQLSNPSRLIKRTKIPRSCAPLQAKAKLTEDAGIYDDADFYQLLLKELVDQRMANSFSSTELIGGDERPIVQWTSVKEAKIRKIVDTKASKGRKMRFTVHEKLQNFMAPDNRGSWEQDAVDRFFGTLLGQKINLGEDEAESGDEEVEAAEKALMLFRS